jgi:hypothetical protein
MSGVCTQKGISGLSALTGGWTFIKHRIQTYVICERQVNNMYLLLLSLLLWNKKYEFISVLFKAAYFHKPNFQHLLIE